MKLCLLTHTFPRFAGDTAAPFMGGLAKGLSEAGHELFVLTPYSPEFRQERSSDPYKLLTYKYIWPDFLHKEGYSQTMTDDKRLKLTSFLLSPFMLAFGTISLYRLVKKEKIELINAHWILPNGFMASLVSLLTGVPVVSTLPGSDVYVAGWNPIYSWAAKFSANISAAITSNSPQLISDLIKIVAKGSGEAEKIKNKTEIIIYGVDTKKFFPNRRRTNSIKKALGIRGDKLIVLGVGRLVAKKGFEYLLKAAGLVIKRNPKVVFVLIGEGDQRKTLEELSLKLNIVNNVKFAGSIDYKSLPDYYNSADIFALPSTRDEKGNLDDQSVSVVEAMACGIPVITTDFPGYRVVIKDGKTGFLLKEKDYKSIAEKIVKLAKSKKLRQKIGKEARGTIISKFSWEKVVKDYTQSFAKRLSKVHKDSYSQSIPKILEERGRQKVAVQLKRVLKRYLVDTKGLVCLDIGCSSGIITEKISSLFKETIGIDVDREALAIANKKYKKKNLNFVFMDGHKMHFKNQSFDVVILNQIYEFVDNPKDLVAEVFRVLKPGGICLVGARNKISLLEGQTGVPLIHFLPSNLTGFISKVLGKEYYPARYLSLWGIRRLFSKFQVHDLTAEIIKDPRSYGFHSLKKYSWILNLIPRSFLQTFVFLSPNFILICKKPGVN